MENKNLVNKKYEAKKFYESYGQEKKKATKNKFKSKKSLYKLLCVGGIGGACITSFQLNNDVIQANESDITKFTLGGGVHYEAYEVKLPEFNEKLENAKTIPNLNINVNEYIIQTDKANLSKSFKKASDMTQSEITKISTAITKQTERNEEFKAKSNNPNFLLRSHKKEFNKDALINFLTYDGQFNYFKVNELNLSNTKRYSTTARKLGFNEVEHYATNFVHQVGDRPLLYGYHNNPDGGVYEVRVGDKFTFEEAFRDKASGNMVDVIFNITEIEKMGSSGKLLAGFDKQGHWTNFADLHTVTWRIDYVNSETKKPITIDILYNCIDIDLLQRMTVFGATKSLVCNNSFVRIENNNMATGTQMIPGDDPRGWALFLSRNISSQTLRWGDIVDQGRAVNYAFLVFGASGMAFNEPFVHKTNLDVNKVIVKENGMENGANAVRTVSHRFLGNARTKPEVSDVVQNVDFFRPYTKTYDVDRTLLDTKYSTYDSKDKLIDEVLPVTKKGYHFKRKENTLQKIIEANARETGFIEYEPDTQRANFVFKNKADQKIIFNDTILGKTNEQINFNIEKRLNDLNALGYNIVSNNYEKNRDTFNDDKNVDQTFTIVAEHFMENITVDNPKKSGTKTGRGDNSYPDGLDTHFLKRTRSRNVKFEYEDHNRAAEDVNQSCDVFRSATFDHVTKKITYGKYSTNTLPIVNAVAINGYTPDKENVPSITVDGENKINNEIFTYTKNARPKTNNGESLKTNAPLTGDKTKTPYYAAVLASFGTCLTTAFLKKRKKHKK